MFHRGNIAMLNSQSWGSELSQVWRGDTAMIAVSNARFGLLDALLRFETTAPQSQKFQNISPGVKIREGVGGRSV